MLSPSPAVARHARRGVRVSLTTRIILAIVSLMLAATYYTPLWTVDLDAPQYPEGLGLEIWINSIHGQNPGDLNKINNLNHYIGMKTIHPESIPELRYMPWIMRGLLLFGLVAAAVGRRKLVIAWLAAFLLLAIAGLVDYYIWGYDFGHNLDMERAIIKIPGMSYQPPLIGSKMLLNFKATSLPGIGGWILIVGCLSVFVATSVEWLKRRRTVTGGTK